MSLINDDKFIEKLKLYINKNDLHMILSSFAKPIENVNINKRTGRLLVGVPETRLRKILTGGSLSNYKSVILKFVKFKALKTNTEAPIDGDIAQEYLKILMNGDRKHQTILTNIRILNRNVFGPILNQELPIPRIQSYTSYNNKPLLTHADVSKTIRYLWKYCKNKDHVYKITLIYYTGLRHQEAESLTYKDILNGWSDKGIIITVRQGKNNNNRHILLYKGAPTHFFLNYLIPFLNMKILCLMNSSNNESLNNLLKHKIFSESSYQSVQKEFKKALNIIIEREEKCNIKNILKGAGIHSIRADYSTRTLKILHDYSKNLIYSLKVVGMFLGHQNQKIIFRHYTNLGYNFNNEENFQTFMSSNNGENNININYNNNDTNASNTTNILESVERGSVADRIFAYKRRKIDNFNFLLNIFDNSDVFSLNNNYINNNTNNNVNINNNNNNNNNNISDDEDEDDDDENILDSFSFIN